MGNITLKDLLGVKVKKIQSASEMMFLYELSKYSKEILNKELDLSEISIIKELKNSEYSQYLYTKGFDLGFDLTAEDIGDISEVSRKFFNSDLSGITFEKQTASEWVYDYNTNRTTNIVLNRYNRSGGYVSLYAYMVVSSYKSKKKVPKLVLKNTSHKQEEFEYVDMIILKYFGNKLLLDKVDLIFSRETVIQPEWEAYIVYNRQLGYMTREYTTAEKIKYVQKNYEVGDIVLFYKTDKAIKSKSIRRLTSCYPAMITNIGKTELQIVYYPDVTTDLTRKRLLEKAEEIIGDGFKHSSSEDRFPSCKHTIDFYNIGIDKLLYNEDEFILKPFNGVDTFEQYIVDKNGVEGVYTMGSLDNLYTFLEDREIGYNKRKFLENYFGKEKPMYDVIKGR